VTWNTLYLTIAKLLAKRRKLVHVPASLARTGAKLTQWAPGAPLTTDQVAMIEAGDNVASATDTVVTFQLPLVALEEQIRRAV
jgi:NADH dehydrogenase